MGNIKVLTGNYSAAAAAALCRPDLIAAYPITPQSSVVEYLAGLVNNGELDSDFVPVESEHSAMSVVQGAAAGGGRVFTATSAQGLALMFEPYFRMSTLRLPMVMAIATREMTSPETVWSGQQDAMSVRDAGWIQVFCDSNQEIADMVIQGYRIAEDHRILLPVNVCYDGFYSSHLTEGINLPTQEEADAFLPPRDPHIVFGPDRPFALDPLTSGPYLMKYRKSHLDAMERALDVIEETDALFAEAFGRSYGGAIEEYRTEDSETVIFTIGGMSGTGKDAVDIMREKGIKVGLIRLRFIRPFPAKRIAKSLKGKKAFAVIDRSVCFGWSQGPMYMEIKAAVADSAGRLCHFSSIGGLGGSDISLDHIISVIERLEEYKNDAGEKPTLWLM